MLPIQERDATNAVTRECTWGLNLGGGIGGLLQMKQQGSAYSYLYDGKGNVSALIDSAQQLVAKYRYDVYGNLQAEVGTVSQPYLFSTKRYAYQLGTYYYGYRFYSPSTGRWLTRDPLGEYGGLNLYGFVGNDPVNRIDALGLWEQGGEGPALMPTTYNVGYPFNRIIEPACENQETSGKDCLDVFYDCMASTMLGPGWSNITVPAGPVAEQYFAGKAFQHSSQRLLTYPFRSSIVRRTLLVGSRFNACALLGTFVAAEGLCLYEEIKCLRNQ